MVPKDVLLPTACECVTLHGKRDFAEVIRFGILRCGDCPELFVGPLNIITRVFIRGRWEGQSRKEMRWKQRLD